MLFLITSLKHIFATQFYVNLEYYDLQTKPERTVGISISKYDFLDILFDLGKMFFKIYFKAYYIELN